MPEINPAEREEFLRQFSVSHETLQKLDRYAALLAEWNARFNLVAESTLPHIWRRHFLDCAQLIKFIPGSAKTISDLGSGAGLPGIILSILGKQQVHLIESTGKKADFLRAAICALELDAIVHQTRIESLRGIRFDVVTARALKPLPQLLELVKPLINNKSLCLFLKGQNVHAELAEASKSWKFDAEIFPSLSDASGQVLKISNLHSFSKKR